MLPLVLTPGDVLGVGPEVAVAALGSFGSGVVLVGDVAALRRWAPGLRVVREWDEGEGLQALDEAIFWDGSEPIEAAAIRFGARLCLEGRARGLVTGPIHKARLKKHGFRWSGHTDFLGHLCGVGEDRAVMAFTAPQLTAPTIGEGIPVCVTLATVHIPLSRVSSSISPEGLRHVIGCTLAGCRALGVTRPVVWVCGLNPHAGEDGYLGSEERDLIAPICAEFRAAGEDVVGPISAETAFIEARRQTPESPIHGIVAMYHDQALVPLKALGFGRCVNWTLGLPMVRTSVDHGTADALVGTGRASAGSMLAALELADRLSGKG